MERISMDILGPLPQTKRGNKYILVVADEFTKWTEAYAMCNQEAETVAHHVKGFVCRWGAPREIHTDQGRQFESRLFQEMCKLMGVVKTRTSPYHPQSDGQVERFNRTLLAMLSQWTENEAEWDEHLESVMLAYRSAKHSSTGFTPYFLMFGREVRLPIELEWGVPDVQMGIGQRREGEYVRRLREGLEKAHNLTRQRLGSAHLRQKEQYDRRCHGAPFEEGERVWLHVPATKRGKCRKFHRPWVGPFQVIKRLSDVTYRVRNPDNPRRRLVVHFNRLKKWEARPGDGEDKGEETKEGDGGTMAGPEETQAEEEIPVNASEGGWRIFSIPPPLEPQRPAADGLNGRTEQTGDLSTERYPRRVTREPDRYQAGL